MQSPNDRLETRKLELENDIAGLELRNEDLETRSVELGEEVTSLKKKVRKGYTKLEAINIKLFVADNQITAAKREATSVKREADLLAATLKRRKSGIDQEVEQYKSRKMADANKELAIADQAVSEAKTTLADNISEITKAETQLSDLDEKHTSAVEASRSEIDGLKEQITDLVDTKGALIGEVAELRSDYQKISVKLTEKSQQFALIEKKHEQFLKYEAMTRKELKAKEDFLAEKEQQLVKEGRHLASRRVAMGNLTPVISEEPKNSDEPAETPDKLGGRRDALGKLSR